MRFAYFLALAFFKQFTQVAFHGIKRNVHISFYIAFSLTAQIRMSTIPHEIEEELYFDLSELAENLHGVLFR